MELEVPEAAGREGEAQDIRAGCCQHPLPAARSCFMQHWVLGLHRGSPITPDKEAPLWKQ